MRQVQPGAESRDSLRLREFYLTHDRRSLGLLRLLLGAMLILDWCSRWPDLEAFYTSSGCFPIDAGMPVSAGVFHFSLLDGVTTLPMVKFVFLAGLFFYLCFFLGYRTKLYHILSFVFFISAVNRVSLLQEGGERVMGCMLLWSLFLPLGTRFSVDALTWIRRDSTERTPAALVSFIIVAQLGLVYFFTACDKCGPMWRSGTALYYVLHDCQFSTPLGAWLSERPLSLLKAVTWGVRALEFSVLPVLLMPFARPWPRRILIVLLTAMHLGIWLTTGIGWFSFVMISTYALLLDAEDWTLLGRGTAALRRACGGLLPRVLGRIRAWLGTLRNTEHGAPISKPSLDGRNLLVAGAADAFVTAIFLMFVIDGYNMNLAECRRFKAIPEPVWMQAVVLVPLLQQSWMMFSPDPPGVDEWWVIQGVTESGEKLDPLTGRAPTFVKPNALCSRNDHFWRNYLTRIPPKKNSQYYLCFGRYITRKNHREYPPGHQLATFTCYDVTEEILPPGSPQPFPTTSLAVWHHVCFDPVRTQTVPKKIVPVQPPGLPEDFDFLLPGPDEPDGPPAPLIRDLPAPGIPLEQVPAGRGND
jgi:hypothetical protein